MDRNLGKTLKKEKGNKPTAVIDSSHTRTTTISEIPTV